MTKEGSKPDLRQSEDGGAIAPLFERHSDPAARLLHHFVGAFLLDAESCSTARLVSG